MIIKEKFISILFLLFLIIIPFVSDGQNFDELNLDEEMEKSATVVNEIKPEFQLWKLSEYSAFQDSTTLDTMIDFFQLFNPVYKNALTVSYVGNYGTPALNNDFFKRESTVDFYFLQYYLTSNTTLMQLA